MLDDTDTALIALLRRNARIGHAEAARLLNLSRTTVQARVESLERRGVIAGYTVKLSEAMDRRMVRAHVTIVVAPKASASVVSGPRADAGGPGPPFRCRSLRPARRGRSRGRAPPRRRDRPDRRPGRRRENAVVDHPVDEVLALGGLTARQSTVRSLAVAGPEGPDPPAAVGVPLPGRIAWGRSRAARVHLRDALATRATVVPAVARGDRAGAPGPPCGVSPALRSPVPRSSDASIIAPMPGRAPALPSPSAVTPPVRPAPSRTARFALRWRPILQPLPRPGVEIDGIEHLQRIDSLVEVAPIDLTPDECAAASDAALQGAALVSREVQVVEGCSGIVPGGQAPGSRRSTRRRCRRRDLWRRCDCVPLPSRSGPEGPSAPAHGCRKGP